MKRKQLPWVICWLTLVVPGLTWAGVNAGARLGVDLDLTTPAVDAARHIPVNSEFDAELVVDKASDLHGVNFDLLFDATLVTPVQVNGKWVQEGPLLQNNAAGDATVFLVDNQPGRFGVSTVILGNDLGVDGGGVLARVRFRVVASGVSSLKLDSVVFVDHQNQHDAVTGNSVSGTVYGYGPAAAFGFRLANQAVVDAPLSVTLTAYDAGGVHNPDFTGTVTLASTDGTATLPPSLTFTAQDHGQKTFTVTFHRTGVFSVTATDTVQPALTGTSPGVAVSSANSGGRYALDVDPAAAGVQAQRNVYRNDEFDVNVVVAGMADLHGANVEVLFDATRLQLVQVNNKPAVEGPFLGSNAAGAGTTFLATADANSVTMSASLLGTDPGAVGEGVLATLRFKAVGEGVANLAFRRAIASDHYLNQDDLTPLAAVATATIGAAPAPIHATHFLVAAPGALPVSESATFSVSAVDDKGQVDATYVGTVTLAATDAAANFPATLVFTAADQGVKSFVGAYFTTGAQHLTATDAQVGLTGTSLTTQVTGLNQQAAVLLDLDPTTSAPDKTRKLAVGDEFELSVDLTQGADVHGAKTDVLFDPSILEVVSVGGSPAVEGTFLSQGGDTTFLTALAPGRVSIAVTLLGTGPGAVGDGCLAIIRFHGKTTGQSPVRVASAVVSDHYGNVEDRSAGAGVGTVAVTKVTRLQVQAPQAVNVGQSFTFTVTAVDDTGFVITNYAGTVSFSADDPKASLPTPYTFQTTDQGRRTFSAALNTVGLHSLTVADTANNLTGRSASFPVIGPSPFAAFAVDADAGTSAIDNLRDLQPDEVFDVSLAAKDVGDLHGFNCDLTYDPTRVAIKTVNGKPAAEGAFLTGNAAGQPTTFLATVIQPGRLNLSGSILGTDAGVDGAGVLATIRLQVTGLGDSLLQLPRFIVAHHDGSQEDLSRSTQPAFLSARDTTPPTIAGANPPDGSQTPLARPVISAVVQDQASGTGVDAATVAMTINGTPVAETFHPATGVVAYQPAVDLAIDAPTQVEVAASDHAGNSVRLAWSFTYHPAPAPTVSDVTPALIPNTGAAQVTVTGSGFLKGVQVWLQRTGESNVTGVVDTLVSSTELKATFPFDVMTAGDWALVVKNIDNKTSSPFSPVTVTGPWPQVQTVTPTQKPNTGAATLTIQGANFQTGAEVRLRRAGQSDLTGAVTGTDTATQVQRTFDLTNVAAGTWDLWMRNPDGGWGQLAQAFTVSPPPTLTAVAPDLVENTGGTQLTFTGSDFQANATLTLTRSGQPDLTGSGVQIVSVAEATAAFDFTGAAVGLWTATLTNPDGGVARLVDSVKVTGPWPQVQTVTPTQKPNTGAATLTIKGANFQTGAEVRLRRAGQADITGTAMGTDTATQVQRTFDLTNVAAGTWDLWMRNPDGGWGQLVQAFTVTPPPTLTAVAPDLVENTGVAQLTFTGSDFQANATLTLTRSGQTDLTGSGVQIVSAAEATAAFDFTGAAVGLWTATLTNPDGGVARLVDSVKVTGPWPTITAITPAAGQSTETQLAVTITGANFQTGAVVQLTKANASPAAATGVTVVSATKIQATFNLLGQAPGRWDVRVLNPDGGSGALAAGFEILSPVTLTSITPDHALNTAKVCVTLVGDNFAAGATARLTRAGQTDIVGQNTQVVSATSLTTCFPVTGKPPGVWNVVVTNTDGSTGALADGFTLTAPPTLTGVAPAASPNTAPVSVTLTGADFQAGAAVSATTAGGVNVPVSNVVVVDATTITCALDVTGVTPGNLTLTVTNPDNGVSGPAVFTVTGPLPTVTAITPNQRSNDQVVSVTVAGTNFRANAAVFLRKTGQTDLAGAQVVVVSATQLNATLDLRGAATGKWTVVVRNADGATGDLPDGFTLTAPPTLIGVAPAAGPNTAPVSVTLTGADFQAGAAVSATTAGGVNVPVSNVVVVDATTITCTLDVTGVTPGNLTLTVTNPDNGVSGAAAFTVTGPLPTVTAITPNQRPNDQVVSVTIAGTNFRANATVFLRKTGQTDLAGAQVNVVSNTRLDATFDLRGASTGKWTVVVRNADGAAGNLPDGFTVSTPPTLTQVSPAAGANDQPLSVTLTGSGFQQQADVRLTRAGQTDVIATGVTYVSSTTLRAVLDLTGVAAGPWTVQVRNPDTGTAMLADSFTVTSAAGPPPVVSQVTPTHAPADGPTSFTVTGSSFQQGATVKLQRAGQTSLAGQVTALTGSGSLTAIFDLEGVAEGPWELVVTNPDGQSSAPFQSVTVTRPSPKVLTTGLSGYDDETVHVLITGKYFRPGATLRLRLPGTGLTLTAANLVVTDTQLQGDLDLHDATPGKWDIVVTNSDGTTGSSVGGFEVLAVQPVVTSVSPPSAPNRGTVTLTVRGDKFHAGLEVRLTHSSGDVRVGVGAVLNGSQEVTATFNVDQAPLGTWSVVVKNPDGGQGRLADGFELVMSLALQSLSPNRASNDGVVMLAVSGSGFQEGIVVSLTGASGPTLTAQGVTVLGSGQFEASFDLTGAPAGARSLVVTRGNETAELPQAFQVTLAPPSLESVAPSRAVNAGAVKLTLTGQNFRPGARALLKKTGQADVEAEPVVVNSDTRLTATFAVTGQFPGKWTVQVINRDGSRASLTSAFELTPAPVIHGVSPSQVHTGAGEVLLTVAGGNFQPGATVTLTTGRGRAVTTLTGSGVRWIDADTLEATVDFRQAPTGDYRVEVVNPDGGSGSLDQGFAVSGQTPLVHGGTPRVAPNTEVVEFHLTGDGFLAGASATLELGGQSRPATNTQRVDAGQLTVEFDLRGAVPGLGRIIVHNPDGRTGALPIRVTRPPSIRRVTPASVNNRAPVVLHVTGTGFNGDIHAVLRPPSGPSIVPKQTGQSRPQELSAAEVTVLSSEELDVRFDVTEAAPGDWTLVLRSGAGLTASAPFRIEQAFVNLWINVSGRSTLRAGGRTTDLIEFGNEGNAAIYDVMLFFTMPHGANYTFPDPNTLPFAPGEDLSQVPLGIPLPGTNLDMVVIWIYRIAPHERSTLPVTFTPYVGMPPIRATLVEPQDTVFSRQGAWQDVDQASNLMTLALAVDMGLRHENLWTLPVPPIEPFPPDLLTEAGFNADGSIPPFSGGGGGGVASDCGRASSRRPASVSNNAFAIAQRLAYRNQVTIPRFVRDVRQTFGGGVGPTSWKATGTKLGTAFAKSAAKAGWISGTLGKVGTGVGYGLQILTLWKLAKFMDRWTGTCFGQRVIVSHDPNEKVGEEGYNPPDAPPGAEPNYITGGRPLGYTVFFENDPETATAPAFHVEVTDPLASEFDLSTFSLGDINLGGQIVSVPSGQQQFETTVAHTTHRFDTGEEITVNVHIQAALDGQSRTVRWVFDTLDPNTGQPPMDPFEGFLPPNTSAPEGEGYVSFSAAPVTGLATGATLRNQATVVFDTNAPMTTAEVRHTLDTDKPESSVAALPETTPEPSFTVSWSGVDGASGVQDYAVYVAEDGAVYHEWLARTQKTSAAFTGRYGHTYRFYSVARDYVGNLEDAPSEPDAVTTIGGRPTAWTGLSMVSLPLVPDDPNPAAICDFPGQSWAWWDPDAQSYVYYQSDLQRRSWFEPREATPGRAFWARFRASARIPSGEAPAQDQPYTIPLRPGWNMIGVPFLRALRWGLTGIQVRLTDGGQPLTLKQAFQQGVLEDYAWAWDPASEQYQLVYDPSELPDGPAIRGQLDPWQGYWVLVHKACELVLPPPSNKSRTAQTKAPRSRGAGEWQVELQLAAGDARDLHNVLGATAVTRAAGGGFQVDAPPAAPGDRPWVDLSFVAQGSGGRTTPRLLAFDLRRPLAGLTRWRMVARTNIPDAPVHLTWPNLSTAPRHYRFTLVDQETGERRYMRTTSGYTFRSDAAGATRQFIVEVDPSGGARLRFGAITVTPSRGGGVDIAFTLSQPAQVQAAIRSSAGRVVHRLSSVASSRQGVSTLHWDGRAAAHRPLPKGVYIVELVAQTDEGQTSRAVRAFRLR